jgi:hypothetical protein
MAWQIAASAAGIGAITGVLQAKGRIAPILGRGIVLSCVLICIFLDLSAGDQRADMSISSLLLLGSYGLMFALIRPPTNRL